jgi:hypothetical protein
MNLSYESRGAFREHDPRDVTGDDDGFNDINL